MIMDIDDRTRFTLLFWCVSHWDEPARTKFRQWQIPGAMITLRHLLQDSVSGQTLEFAVEDATKITAFFLEIGVPLLTPEVLESGDEWASQLFRRIFGPACGEITVQIQIDIHGKAA